MSRNKDQVKNQDQEKDQDQNKDQEKDQDQDNRKSYQAGQINPEHQKEKAVLVALTDTSKSQSDEETLSSIEELELLAETAGARVVATAVQRHKGIDSRTYVGKGKLEEIKNACEELDADLIIFDDELFGSQIRSIEDFTNRKVIDRTLLILDIFAQRAVSREGKLQVELALQRYRYSRLVGLGKSLSRLGGGIGTRGPGESKLESDRRHLNRRIGTLKKSLADIAVRRERVRSKRSDKDAVIIAVVGYTNAGKSSLINRLCGSNLFAEDMLFATLDPTARSLVLPGGTHAVLVDTVGFIRKLPHHLVEAFKSTLEELQYADLILHVVDASDRDLTRHCEIVEELLAELKSAHKPRITVFNKIDQITKVDKDQIPAEPVFNGKDGTLISISALTGEGFHLLAREIERHIRQMSTILHVLIPYDRAQLLDYIRKNGSIEQVEYLDEGIRARIALAPSKTEPLRAYVVRD